MHVYRPTYSAHNASGERVQRKSSRYWLEFIDQNEIRRRVPGFNGRAESEELGRKLGRLVDCKRLGERPDAALTKWLESMSAALRNKLSAFGLVDASRVAATRTIQEHVEDFRVSLVAKGTTEKQAGQVASRANRVFTKANCRYWSDVSPSRVQQAANDLCKDDNLSAQSFNFFVGAAKQFARWLWREGRIAEHTLAHLQGRNVREDRRHDRRALEFDEVCRLLAAAHNGPIRSGMDGPARALLYRLALETGLRANELRSLTRSSLELSEAEPTVTVSAAYSKNGRSDTLFLRPDTAAELRAFTATMLPTAHVFNMPKPDHVSKVLRADLKAAQVEYCDASGRYADFHALRHTFISNLAKSGVHPKTAQTLARHGSISLTMDRYTHTNREAESKAINALPSFSGAEHSSGTMALATGTDGHRVQENLGPGLGSGATKRGNLVQLGERKDWPPENPGPGGGAPKAASQALAEPTGGASIRAADFRRSGRAADCVGFENRLCRKVHGGSNPSSSAI